MARAVLGWNPRSSEGAVTGQSLIDPACWSAPPAADLGTSPAAPTTGVTVHTPDSAAFVGLGGLGALMAQALADSNYELHVLARPAGARS